MQRAAAKAWGVQWGKGWETTSVEPSLAKMKASSKVKMKASSLAEAREVTCIAELRQV